MSFETLSPGLTPWPEGISWMLIELGKVIRSSVARGEATGHHRALVVMVESVCSDFGFSICRRKHGIHTRWNSADILLR